MLYGSTLFDCFKIDIIIDLPHINEVIDNSINRIIQLMKEGGYKFAVYSSEDDGYTLGTSTFRVGGDVLIYIVESLDLKFNRYQSE